MGSTIKDIAKDTGLSLATISKYLNHKPISEKNRLLIEESIQKRNYTPNRSAQSLRSKSSHCICIFMPDIQDYFFGQECDYILKAMQEKGFSAMIRSYTEENDIGETDVSFLENRQFAGVILFARVSFPPLLLSYLKSNEIPFVCMHQKSNLPVDFAAYDVRTGGKLAAEYLLNHGHTRTLLIGLDSYSSARKVEGFLSAYQEKGCDISLCSVALFPYADIADNRTLPMPSQNGPTAILFLDHFTSLSLIGRFLEKGAGSQPGYSIMAFDDDEVFSAIIPSITVLLQDARELGQRAADLLYRRICHDYEDFPQNDLVPVTLVERESIKSLL